MSFVRLYSGSDGESHFEDIDMGFTSVDMSPIGSFSPAVSRAPVHIVPEKVRAVVVGSQTEENAQEFHPTRGRHYLITLSGMGELEVGSGEVRRFGPGDWLIDGDETGRGHKARVVEAPWQWCAILLERSD